MFTFVTTTTITSPECGLSSHGAHRTNTSFKMFFFDSLIKTTTLSAVDGMYFFPKNY